MLKLFRASILLVFAFLFLAFASANLVQAADDGCSKLKAQFERFGGGPGSDFAKTYEANCIGSPSSAYQRVTTLGFSLVGIAAVISAMYGGFVYLTAQGNESTAKRGRSIITWSIGGLALVLIAVTIVQVISRFLTS